MRLSIRSRIGLWFVALSGGLLVAFAVALYAVVREAELRALDGTLSTRAAACAALVEYDEGQLEVESPGTGSLATPEGWGYAIFMPGLPEPVISSASFGALADAAHRRLVAHLRPRTDPGSDPRAAPELRVEVVADLAPVAARLGRLRLALGACAGLAVLLTLAASWLVSRRIVRPLRAMATAAQDLGAANPGGRIPLPGTGDEIEQLGQSLNDAFGRLQGLLERQTRFTADAAHELRTPLAIIRTNAEVAGRGSADLAAHREAMAGVLEGAQRLASILEALLVLARVDRGQLATQPVDLAELARATLADVAPAAQDLTLTGAVPDSLIVPGDPDQLGIALRNLLDNAVRYTPAGGTVSLHLEARDGDVVLEITDTGPGIPPEDLPRIFDRFTRVDPARDRASGGVGLGLSIVRAVVDMHGGRIDVASEPGAGTTVTVRLPA
jgi:signal transduction histidine kinase